MDFCDGISISSVKSLNEKLKDTIENQPLHSKWHSFLEFIKNNVSKVTFKTWFEPLKILNFDNNELVIRVPSQFYTEWLDTHYYSLIKTALEIHFGYNVKLKYEVLIDNSAQEETFIKITSFNKTNLEQIKTNTIQALNYDPHLISDYLFENFIVGDSNRFAYTLSLETAKEPKARRYNPLTIIGHSGIGKTHLLHSIGNYILLNHPSIRVMYVSSEDFTNNFINSLKNKTTLKWTSMIRSLDVLLIDDIHFFQNKHKIQEQFYQTFHNLIQSGKQIVLTCDKLPSEIGNFHPKLVSSINWGIIAKIDPPNYEIRLAFIQRKCEEEGLPLSMDVIEYIAQNVTGSIREINGIIISLLADITFSNHIPDIYLAKQILKNKNFIEPSSITIEFIISEVEKFYNLPPGSILSRSRKKEISNARHLAIYLAKELSNKTLSTIAQKFGNRNHSTILHALNTMEKNLLISEHIRKDYNYLLKKLL